MKGTSKAVVAYAAGWATIVFFVVLLTLIFSFLGTLICAALAGMMMGAARPPRWQSLALSLVFPVVISTVLRVSRAELHGSQILFLSLLCFALFWLIYTAIAALTCHERKQAVSLPAGVIPPADPALATAVAAGQELSLDILEGAWFAESVNFGAGSHRKKMIIERESLVLSLTDPGGRTSFCAKAQLKLCPGPVLTITSSPAGINSSADGEVCI
jgi:hypothetical protein